MIVMLFYSFITLHEQLNYFMPMLIMVFEFNSVELQKYNKEKKYNVNFLLFND